MYCPEAVRFLHHGAIRILPTFSLAKHSIALALNAAERILLKDDDGAVDLHNSFGKG